MLYDEISNIISGVTMPVEIQAMQLVGSPAETHAVYEWVEANTQGSFNPEADPAPISGVSIDPATGHVLVATPEGVVQAKPGDWIVRGVQGEFYVPGRRSHVSDIAQAEGSPSSDQSPVFEPIPGRPGETEQVTHLDLTWQDQQTELRRYAEAHQQFVAKCTADGLPYLSMLTEALGNWLDLQGT